MANIIQDEKELIKNKFEYIELDLNKIPEEVIEYKPLEFRPSKAFEEASHKVYKYVDVRKIQILLTNKNRLDALNERFSVAMPIGVYLKPKDENDIRKTYKVFEDVKGS